MGRGSSGVAAVKGKSMTTEQAQAASVTSYVQLRVAIENGKDTAPAEKAYKSRLKKFSINYLEKEHAKRLKDCFLREDSQTKEGKVAYKVCDKMEFAARQELMKRDPKKYDADWYHDLYLKTKKMFVL